MSKKLKSWLKNTGLALPLLIGMFICLLPSPFSWPVGMAVIILVALGYLILFGRKEAMDARVRWAFITGFVLLAAIISSVTLNWMQVEPGLIPLLIARGLALLVGIVLSYMITWLFFMAVIYVSSVYVLTLHKEENISLWEAIRFMHSLIRGSQHDWVEVKGGEAKELKKKGTMEDWSSLGKIIIAPGHAVVLEKKTEFSRVLGVGSHVKKKGEKVREVFELKGLSANPTLENVITRDQFPLTIKMSVGFKIKAAEDPKAKEVIKDNWEVFTPVGEATLKKGAASTGGGWKKRPEGAAVGALRDQIMTYTLDELFKIQENGQDPVQVNNRRIKIIEDAVKEAASEAVSKGGLLEVSGVDIQEITLPDDARERIKADSAKKVEAEKNTAKEELVSRILDDIGKRTGKIGPGELRVAVEMVEKLSEKKFPETFIAPNFLVGSQPLQDANQQNPN